MAKLKNMFAHWLDKRLFFLSAFGEHPLGQMIARYLTEETNSRTLILPNEASMYYSSFHGSFTHPTREIDLVAFEKFIALECGEEVRQLHHAIKNSQALQQIASGLNIWRQNGRAMAMELLSKYGGLPQSLIIWSGQIRTIIFALRMPGVRGPSTLGCQPAQSYLKSQA
jgi:hypothetical protein